MKENIEEAKKQLQIIQKIRKEQKEIAEEAGGFCVNCDEDIMAIDVILGELEKLQKENEELKEYKRISELTKISCCTAQNCGALSNAIRDSLENEKLKAKNEELKTLIAHKNGYTQQLEEDLFENASNYVISKQKIKDKIEEVKNEEDLYARGNIIAILLELLEEE